MKLTRLIALSKERLLLTLHLRLLARGNLAVFHFPTERLTMLGAKSTVKDRWRQVLSEAERIQDKHLITLEPSISENQTNEMRAKKLQLVVPRRLHATFLPTQRQWLATLADFIEIVGARQAR